VEKSFISLSPEIRGKCDDDEEHDDNERFLLVEQRDLLGSEFTFRVSPCSRSSK